MVNKKSTLGKRYQASYESKEGSSPRKGVMNYKKVNGEISFFSPQEGKNRINIIPYEIKTKNHPLVKRGEFSIGDKDYVMDIFTHRSVGPTEATVLCLKGTYGKPCPICELSAKFRSEGKEKEANELKSGRRVFYNVEDCKEPGKLKIFETSHYLFEKELIDEARDDEEGGFVDFADPEEGKEIKFRASEVQKGPMKYKEFKSFSFEDRDEPISDELLDSAISFDEIMTIPTYEDVEKILYGSDDEDNEEETSKKKSPKEDEDDDEPKKSSKHDDDEDDEPVKTSKKHQEEDDGDDEPPKKSKKDDEDEQEEKTEKKSTSGKCPFGHKFGVDTDSFGDCDNCNCWDKCCRGE